MRLLRRIGVSIIAVAVIVAIATWVAVIVLRPHPPSPRAITQAMRAQAALTGGARVYAVRCGYCHATNVGPAVTGLALPVTLVRWSVRSGPAFMPSFTPTQVSDGDIDAVTQYINSQPTRGAK